MSGSPIFHLISAADWQQALDSGAIAPESIANEGFVHCSTAEQVPGVAARFYADVADLLAARIDTALLGDVEVKWEPPAHPDGAATGPDETEVRFPHVYGPIPIGAVVSVDPVQDTA